MNGVIHNCTHSNEGDGNLGISENEMFLQIFKYTETLFSKIRPSKVFMIAIDGVAPRAKMNEQRARRFRKIRDLEELKEKELQKGREIVELAHEFDSNCITPGTEFMERLNEQLKYFINKKMSEDADWKKVQVILSGYDVPGEGEHKITEYIRFIRSQPDHNPNTRHCLYGLDADLVMLGLSSHEPHFCLLRELLTFSRKKNNKGKGSHNGDEAGKFILLNLSVLREYLEFEFIPLKDIVYPKGDIGYDFEKVLDDFLLFSMLAGNDFVKNLPSVHIGEGALALLIGIYIKVRPKLGGYLINSGMLNLPRLQIFFRELSIVDKQSFEANVDGLEWYENYLINKKSRELNSKKQPNDFNLTEIELEILHLIKSFAIGISTGKNYKNVNNLIIQPEIAENNYTWINKVAHSLSLFVYKEYDASGSVMVIVTTDKDSSSYSSSESDADSESESGSNSEQDIFDFSKKHRSYTLSKSQIQSISSSLENQVISHDFEAIAKQQVEDQKAWEYHFEEWKSDYYQTKLGFDYNINDVLNSKESTLESGIPVRVPPKQVKDMCQSYIVTLQWIVYYYFKGIRSWTHYYPYHYSPYVSDLLSGIADFAVPEFPPSEPYMPVEQLMFVLPPGSSSLIPKPLRQLMHDKNSPIYDLFPATFEIDLNGKKNDWEAISLIDFIDIDRVLKAMEPLKSQFSPGDTKRNRVGHNISFKHKKELEKSPLTYHSSNPRVFPDLVAVTCEMSDYHIPRITDDKLKLDLLKGSRTGSGLLPGFPTTKTLSITSNIESAGLVVFSQGSRNESVILSVNPRVDFSESNKLEEYLEHIFEQKKVFVDYPNLKQSKVVAVSTNQGLYIKSNNTYEFRPFLTPSIEQKWAKLSERVRYSLFIKKGIKADTSVLVHVLPLKGMSMKKSGALVCEYAPNNERHLRSLVDPSLCSDWEYTYPASLVLTVDDAIESIKNNPSVPKSLKIPEWANDPRYQEKKPTKIGSEFSVGQKVFYLKDIENYGSPAIITNITDGSLHLKVLVPSYPRMNNLIISLGKRVLNGTVDVEGIKSILNNNDFSLNSPINFNAIKSSGPGKIYMQSFHLCKKLNISSFMLSKITASIFVDPENGSYKKIELALTLKLEGKGMRAPGYTTRSEKGWEYSEKAAILLQEYVSKFRNIINRVEYIVKANHVFAISINDIIDNNAQITRESIEKMGEWVKEKSNQLPELEPIDSEKFSSDKVAILEESIDLCLNQNLRDPKTSGSAIKFGLKAIEKVANDRCDLLKPKDAQLSLVEQAFALGDRVVLVAESGVPILCGSMGYVIGINAKQNYGNPYKNKSENTKSGNMSGAVRAPYIDTLDVVWDRAIMSGSGLNGLCSLHRGYSVQPTQILNLTIPQLARGFRASSYGLSEIQNVAHTEYNPPEGAYNFVPPPNSFRNKNDNQWNRGYNRHNSGNRHENAWNSKPQKTFNNNQGQSSGNFNQNYQAKNNHYQNKPPAENHPIISQILQKVLPSNQLNKTQNHNINTHKGSTPQKNTISQNSSNSQNTAKVQSSSDKNDTANSEASSKKKNKKWTKKPKQNQGNTEGDDQKGPASPGKKQQKPKAKAQKGTQAEAPSTHSSTNNPNPSTSIKGIQGQNSTNPSGESTDIMSKLKFMLQNTKISDN
ncbi:5'-3' exoribonuclease 1 [Smittium culicis]|uniref:5'-3' exoribonuclease 1 n=1 Tax=Smittium culicis TaxID=133412 RepID=A0A1R1XX71_9FUNG|nr:5'-3' exoribonuclease 1 [Smittium culicis]